MTILMFEGLYCPFCKEFVLPRWLLNGCLPIGDKLFKVSAEMDSRVVVLENVLGTVFTPSSLWLEKRVFMNKEEYTSRAISISGFDMFMNYTFLKKMLKVRW